MEKGKNVMGVTGRDSGSINDQGLESGPDCLIAIARKVADMSEQERGRLAQLLRKSGECQEGTVIDEEAVSINGEKRGENVTENIVAFGEFLTTLSDPSLEQKKTNSVAMVAMREQLGIGTVQRQQNIVRPILDHLNKLQEEDGGEVEKRTKHVFHGKILKKILC